MSFESKNKFVSEKEFNERTEDFTGIVLIRDSSIHQLFESYLEKLVPGKYQVFDLKFLDEKLNTKLPINLGINMFKYKSTDIFNKDKGSDQTWRKTYGNRYPDSSYKKQRNHRNGGRCAVRPGSGLARRRGRCPGRG